MNSTTDNVVKGDLREILAGLRGPAQRCKNCGETITDALHASGFCGGGGDAQTPKVPVIDPTDEVYYEGYEQARSDLSKCPAQAPSGAREALERIAAFNIRPSTGTSVAMLMRDIAKDALSAHPSQHHSQGE
jgi:hypothetical protein